MSTRHGARRTSTRVKSKRTETRKSGSRERSSVRPHGHASKKQRPDPKPREWYGRDRSDYDLSKVPVLAEHQQWVDRAKREPLTGTDWTGKRDAARGSMQSRLAEYRDLPPNPYGHEEGVGRSVSRGVSRHKPTRSPTRSASPGYSPPSPPDYPDDGFRFQQEKALERAAAEPAQLGSGPQGFKQPGRERAGKKRDQRYRRERGKAPSRGPTLPEVTQRERSRLEESVSPGYEEYIQLMPALPEHTAVVPESRMMTKAEIDRARQAKAQGYSLSGSVPGVVADIAVSPSTSLSVGDQARRNASRQSSWISPTSTPEGAPPGTKPRPPPGSAV